MPTIRVDWASNSECIPLLRKHTAFCSSNYSRKDDPLEAMGEVAIGIQAVFTEGQLLDGESVGLLLTIINRRVHNYFRSHGVGWRKQPNRSLFDHPEVENLKSAGSPPDQVVADRELFGMIESELSKMPPHWAEAVRSKFGLPGAPEWAELVQTSGTTRQNMAKRAKRGLEELKLRFA
jgi:hypothetical protein